MSAAVRWLSRRPLLSASCLVVFCAVMVEWSFVFRGEVPTPPDNVYYFYPLNDLTGKTLRAGHLPVWNVHQMSGMPLMGDPQAGWGSIVTMLSYALLPMAEASGLTLLLHMALSGLGMLFFMRSTGVGITGCTLGALAYMLSGQLLATRIAVSYGNFAYVGALTWLPWLLLGTDIAIRHTGRKRLLGWCLAGFAASQELSAWLGQGAYYAFGAAVAYVLFLTVLDPPFSDRAPRSRLKALALHSAALTVIGAALSAWTLFPRLELFLVSSLRGGYGSVGQQFEGGSDPTVVSGFLEPGRAYVGAATLVLALAAPLLRPTRRQWFYLGMAVVCYLVSLRPMVELAEGFRPARALFGLVPGLLQLHLHYPERVAFVYLFFTCALAGSTLERLLRASGKARRSLPLAVTGMVVALFVLGRPLSAYLGFGVGLLVAVAIIAYCWRRGLAAQRAALLLVALTALELVASVTLAHTQYLTLDRPDSYYAATNTPTDGGLLNSSTGDARYFGYSGRVVRTSDDAYRKPWAQPHVRDLLVTTQATVLGLEDIQGYNPVHLRVYDKLLAVANGREQYYRGAYVMPEALRSPLLDILNVRYALAKTGTRLGLKYWYVAGQGDTLLYRNVRALPRAWVVNRYMVRDDKEALYSIHNRLVNPRSVALIPQPIKKLGRPSKPQEVILTEHRPERIEISARLAAPGLVVLSELDYPAWKVKVDGKPRPALRANGTLRAVRVPRGSHKITWHYDSSWTRAGFTITAVALALLCAAFALWPHLARAGSLARWPRPASSGGEGRPARS